MSRHTRSLPPSYFEERYAADPDPWRFATSAYERDKYAATLAALPRDRYADALEVGCSIGVLTLALAARCDRLLALDVAETALAQARARCADEPGIRFLRCAVPKAWPDGRFDLMLFSEVLYYLDAADLTYLSRRVLASLRPGGHCVLVHWTGQTHYPLGGNEAAERFIDATRTFLRLTHQSRTEAYRLDVLASTAGAATRPGGAEPSATA